MITRYCQYHHREVTEEELEDKHCLCKKGNKKCRYLQTKNRKPKYRNSTFKR